MHILEYNCGKGNYVASHFAATQKNEREMCRTNKYCNIVRFCDDGISLFWRIQNYKIINYILLNAMPFENDDDDDVAIIL